MPLGNAASQEHRHTILWVSLLASAVSVATVVARVVYSGQGTYVFLIWNLILAWIPLLFSFLAEIAYQKRSKVGLWAILCGLGWLVFFPNAPYILTDFFHLQARPPVPLWFDLIVLFSFAWNGIFLGFNSLYVMQRLVAERLGRTVGWVFVLLVLGLSGFGIYLGRFLGWNSWDVLVSPRDLGGDILGRLAHPLANFQTFAVAFALAVVLGSIYLSLYALTRIPRRAEAGEEGRGLGGAGGGSET